MAAQSQDLVDIQEVHTVNGIRSDVTPDAPASAQPAIGLIGMGEMGRMYAAHLARAGWKK